MRSWTRRAQVVSRIISDDTWGSYFSAVAGASGAIFALLFVAMQVQIRTWRGNPLRIYAVALALFELAAPLFISLVALMPGATWHIGARGVAVVGCIAAAGHLVVLARFHARDTAREPGKRTISRLDVVRVGIGTIGSLLLFAWLLRSTYRGGIEDVGWICLWLVLWGLIESFVFLAHWRPLSD